MMLSVAPEGYFHLQNLPEQRPVINAGNRTLATPTTTAVYRALQREKRPRAFCKHHGKINTTSVLSDGHSIGNNKETEVGKILVDRLARNLADRHLLQPAQSILVAVSGGQDSICLLWMMSQLQQQWGWSLGIVHCDHQWSPQSSQQASHVSQVARAMGFDFYRAVATRDASGETRARSWRYGVFQRIAIRHGYDAIVTAHTASDRVETLLHNLFRGSGPRGLQSLSWKRQLLSSRPVEFGLGVGNPRAVHEPCCGKRDLSFKQVALVRPLLDTSRAELRELSQTLDLPLWPDPTNFSLKISRNRIRHELLPYLRKHFYGGIDRSLAKWAEILHGEQSYMDFVCESIRSLAEKPHHSSSNTEHGIKLDVSVLESLPLALQRLMLKQFIESYTGRSVGFDQIEGVRLAYGQTSNHKKCLHVSIRGGFQLRLEGKEIVLVKAKPTNTCNN